MCVWNWGVLFATIKKNEFEYDETIHPVDRKIPAGYNAFHGRYVKIGLPILPKNISPVPEDLNDLIAHKKGISVSEAFGLDREKLAYETIEIKGEHSYVATIEPETGRVVEIIPNKFNALWDAKVIKEVYNKLK